MKGSPQVHSVRPWHHEPWPWLLMAGPAIVVVAGLATAWIAVTHEDGLVADDYYRQGLAINQEMRRDSAAAALNLRAQLMFGEKAVRVLLSGSTLRPGDLTLTLAHPTRAGLDRKAQLANKGEGWYEGALPVLGNGRWHLLLEDGAGKWRLRGDWIAGEQGSLELAATAPPREGKQR